MNPLTDIEQQVLKLFLAEYTNPEIAALLNRSVRTIEGIKKRIMIKLGVETNVGLIRYAFEAGWLDSKTLQPVNIVQTRDQELHRCLKQLHKALTNYLQ